MFIAHQSTHPECVWEGVKIPLFERCFSVVSFRFLYVSKTGGVVEDGFVFGRSGILFQFPLIVLPSLRML